MVRRQGMPAVAAGAASAWRSASFAFGHMGIPGQKLDVAAVIGMGLIVAGVERLGSLKQAAANHPNQPFGPCCESGHCQVHDQAPLAGNALSPPRRPYIKKGQFRRCRALEEAGPSDQVAPCHIENAGGTLSVRR